MSNPIDIEQLREALDTRMLQQRHHVEVPFDVLDSLAAAARLVADGEVIRREDMLPMVRMGGLSPAWYPQDADDTDEPDGWLIIDLGSQP